MAMQHASTFPPNASTFPPNDCVSPETLPLFAETELAGETAAGGGSASFDPRTADPPAANLGAAKRPAADPRAVAERHLLAARRLSRQMRTLPGSSLKRRKTGQAICRHLLALLNTP